MDSNFAGEPLSSTELANQLLERGQTLLLELQRLNAQPRNPYSPQPLSRVPILITAIKNEISRLENMHAEFYDKYPEEEVEQRIQFRLAGCSIPASEALWNVLKRCVGLINMHAFYSTKTNDAGANRGDGIPSKERAFVDAVVSSGEEWLRVIHFPERRLLAEMANAGWVWQDEEDSNPEAQDPEGADADEDDKTIIASIKRLIAAASAHRHRCRRPRVRIVFPKVEEGGNPEVDRFLNWIRSLGGQVEVTVDCINSGFLASQIPALQTALDNLAAPLPLSLTSTVSLDVTVLIALASDITNTKYDPNRRYHPGVKAQVEREMESSSLLDIVYPTLAGRDLVATKAAVAQLEEILTAIRITPTERQRASIILNDTDHGKPQDEVQAAFQQLSVHPVPQGLRLPIQIVSDDIAESLDTAASAAVRKDVKVTEMNEKTFLYGWTRGISTVTSNRGVVKRISKLVYEEGREGEAVPDIWVYPVHRSFASGQSRPT